MKTVGKKRKQLVTGRITREEEEDVLASLGDLKEGRYFESSDPDEVIASLKKRPPDFR